MWFSCVIFGNSKIIAISDGSGSLRIAVLLNKKGITIHNDIASGATNKTLFGIR